MADKPTPILELLNIGKRFPGVVALDNVNLSVDTGEIVALIGENGAGKSTLMKILGGAINRDSGTVKIDGKEVEIKSPREASALGIEFIHQELSVLDNLDVAANIFLRREPTIGGFLKLIDRKRLYSEADQLLKKLGLDLSSRTSVSRLSIAQQQMVEIARAISTGARIIIMDEPTSSLTLTETQRLLEIVKDLKAHHVSIIYISHRLHEVEEIADRAVVLRDGRNAGELARNEINRDRMVRMMVGRDLKEMFKHTGNGNHKGNHDWFAVEGLRTQRYPNQPISFNVARGEVLGIAGLVGSGRSEMARTIFGVDEAVEAKVKLNGKVLSFTGPRDAINHGVYLVPEDRRNCGLVVDFNVRENISLPNLDSYSTAKIISTARETTAALNAVKSINIKTPSPEMRAANLSGGNQQKVVLARWLTFSPKVIIFDEPTRGIDVGAKAEIYALIRKLASDGVSVIVISSEMEEVLGISDRIAVMHEGRITGILDRPQFSEEAVMHLATGAAG
ncbi:MAG TPA: sugar ABC transporter ATP-binding protein [Pyrinomonadaceae bacterium]|jgi:ABC-type sugar transport system, ATPase component|nr:sugar ABC transporter ATP-binding protein [Pyrinomonadaceae bacterium]